MDRTRRMWETSWGASETSSAGIKKAIAKHPSGESLLSTQQNGQTSSALPDYGFFQLCCSVFHENLAELSNTGQHVISAEFTADQSRSQCGINGEIAWWRDVLSHQ